jgi:signal transduction histidine kinase
MTDHRGFTTLWTRSPHLMRLIGVVAVIQIGGTVLASHHQEPHRALDWLGVALLSGAVVALAWLRRTTEGVLAAVFVCTLAYWSLGYPRGPVFIALIVAFGGVILAGHRRVALVAMIAGWLLFPWLGYWLGNADSPGWGGTIALAVWLPALWSFFEVVRSRRERGLEVRRSEEEAQLRRVADERLRIAQDVHDAVAHSMSLINIQAGVALHLMDERPEQVREALTTIKQASRDALVELRSIVDVLRQVEDVVPRAPAPSLERVDELVAGAEAAGVRVRLEKQGDLSSLPRNVDLAAYRIIQESLTNVARHAGRTDAVVRINSYLGYLNIEVVDEGGAARAPRPDLPVGGNGLVGMHERAASVGGEVHAGRRAGNGFAVRARLPLGGDR